MLSPPTDQAPSDLSPYRDAWISYYERQRQILLRIGSFAALAVVMSLLVVLTGSLVSAHPWISNIIGGLAAITGGLGAVATFAAGSQWFLFV
jgi:hypothetical protein